MAIALALFAALAAIAPATASATHFRYGNLTWQKAGPSGGGATQVTFQYEQAWRASFFGGNPAVGDVVSNAEGCIDFGDGTDVCPMYRVTFVDTAMDYLVMHALAPGSSSDPNVPHTYTTAGPFRATTGGCCTIGTVNNTGDVHWRVSALVDLARDDESPSARVPPVVQLAAGGVQSFAVTATDAGAETLRFRLTTAEESCQCATPHPPGLSIDSVTGRVSWDTTGRDVGSGLWWTGVVVEAVVAGQVVSSTQVDYVIRVVAPTLGRTAVAQLVSGDVSIRLPAGQSGAPTGYVPLTGMQVVPIGSIVNARRGRVALTTASSARTRVTRTQRAEFYGGIFQIRQRRTRSPTTDILLRSADFVRQCGRGADASAASAATGGLAVAAQARRSRKVVSRLWGNGRGRFRTRGRNSAATVRGTIWLTEERCDGTLTRVTRGVVSVRDLRANRTVTVRAGRSYLARAVRASLGTRRP